MDPVKWFEDVDKGDNRRELLVEVNGQWNGKENVEAKTICSSMIKLSTSMFPTMYPGFVFKYLDASRRSYPLRCSMIVRPEAPCEENDE